jgi:hypothetical protein
MELMELMELSEPASSLSGGKELYLCMVNTKAWRLALSPGSGGQEKCSWRGECSIQ